MNAKEIRLWHGLPRRKIAARADVCELSVKTYEASRDAVTEPIRQKLDPIYADLETSAASES